MILTHGSLFSGIGGFDLAAEWMGWENVFHCEKNEFGRKILNYYWPQSISYHDIKETDFTKHTGEIDVLTGGFPCQPYSNAGARKGKEDDRHLWPEMLRAIREIKPRWIIGENVSGIISWNEGMVFEEVQLEMENQGYETTSFVLPACAVGAPHRRDRVWFVSRFTTNSNSVDSEAFTQKKILGQKSKIRQTKRHFNVCSPQSWDEFPTQSPVLSRNDGLPSELDGITFSKWRRESVKAYGNAVVPQLVLQIFKAIQEFETLINQ